MNAAQNTAYHGVNDRRVLFEDLIYTPGEIQRDRSFLLYRALSKQKYTNHKNNILKLLRLVRLEM